MKYTFTITALLLVTASVAQNINFVDITDGAGIGHVATNSGAAFADFDNDGDDDVYVSVLGGQPNRLYENLGNNTFREVTVQAGAAYQGSTVTSVWGDVNNDGFADLYLGNSNEPNKLLINNGNGTFTDMTAAAGVADEAQPRAVLMADVDNDGLLDIYVANVSAPNVLYHNNGNLTFTDITEQAGAIDDKVAMGSIFFDYDNDGDQDLYLTHDGRATYILYQNDGTGKFTDVAEQAGVNYKGYGMGVDVGDYNRDGHLDIYITDFFENVLFSNNGDGTFTDVSAVAGVDDLGMGWSTQWLDYDNDGLTDIYMVNDSEFTPYSNILYRNNGDGTFSNVSDETPLYSFLGAYGMACADINADGMVDVFVANKGSGGNELFMNQTAGNNWLALQAIGTQSNRMAVGTRVEVTSQGITQIDEISAGSGYASQNSAILHFGLGAAATIDALTIRWPSGLVEQYTNLEANFRYQATEGNGISGGPDNDAIPPTDPPVVTGLTDGVERLKVFPNPASNAFTVTMPQHFVTEALFTLYNMSGQALTQLQPQHGAAQLYVQLPTYLTTGIYIAQITTPAKTWRTKLTIIK